MPTTTPIPAAKSPTNGWMVYALVLQFLLISAAVALVHLVGISGGSALLISQSLGYGLGIAVVSLLALFVTVNRWRAVVIFGWVCFAFSVWGITRRAGSPPEATSAMTPVAAPIAAPATGVASTTPRESSGTFDPSTARLSHQQSPSGFDPSTAPPVAAEPPASANPPATSQQSKSSPEWDAAVAAFLVAHPEYQDTDRATRLQAYISQLDAPGLSDAELLERARAVEAQNWKAIEQL